VGVADPAAEAATGVVPPTPVVNGVAVVTGAMMHIASHTQPFGTTAVAMDPTGGDAGPGRSATDSAGSAVAPPIAETTPVAPTHVSGAASVDPAAAAILVATAELPRAPSAGGIKTMTVPVADGAANLTAQPVAGAADNASAVTQPAASEPAMAAFYAARGDAMLAHKDLSAARKFYEFAANAGSARAAAALARTYAPAFAAQLGQVGVRPDPALAASWYRRAEQLASKSAQLSQSDGSGK
jgi:hypothetical protein